MFRPHLMLLLLVFCSALVGAEQEVPLTVALTASEDHQRLLDLLQITKLRRGADGYNPESEFAANYDEKKANANMHSLPDPLLLDNGDRVNNADDWWSQRRPEIVEHFDREIYGRVPAELAGIDWLAISTEKSTLADIPVVTKTVTGAVDNSTYPAIEVVIQLTVTWPEAISGPVPVILQLGYDPEFMARFRKRFTAEQLKAISGGGPSWQEQVISRGWAYAEMVTTSAQADSGDGLAAGIIGLANKGQPRGLDDWGALRAWAWAAARTIDYFETLESVDAKRVGIEGHSRFGKAALVAMAYESRFAVVFVSSSGEGGAKLWRRSYGEQIGNIAGSGEYHWVAGNFLKYAGPLDANDLPVDAHQLIAMCAPRPVFISSGTDGDQWVDPRGMFLAAAGASSVYELLGKRGLELTEYPAVGTALMKGDLAWRQHDLGHTPGPNWPYFLDFAARYFE